MKVNFKQFPMYVGIRKTERVAVDISESLANLIYMNIPGIAAHVLAEKIYAAEGEIELTDAETGIISGLKEGFTPVFIDSWDTYVKEQTEKKEE